MLVLIQGPAGGAKSQVAAEMLEAGEVQVLADTTALWAALSGVQRGPDGKYPVRQDDDPGAGGGAVRPGGRRAARAGGRDGRGGDDFEARPGGPLAASRGQYRHAVRSPDD